MRNTCGRDVGVDAYIRPVNPCRIAGDDVGIVPYELQSMAAYAIMLPMKARVFYGEDTFYLSWQDPSKFGKVPAPLRKS